MRKYFSFWSLPFCLATGLLFFSCDENNKFIIFSIEDDRQLGRQVSQEIENDPSFNILEENDYPFAYQYIEDMRDEILNSGNVTYKDEFVWQVKLIGDDNTLNAFATPGGYIYIYTGLIKFLDNADDLAGVLGHEIAHADLRHTSRNLQRSYTVSILLSVILGNDPSVLEEIAAQIAGSLGGLAFSREFETEADDESVAYLSNTTYACNGASFFFEKLLEEDRAGRQPEFLSTHPSPDNRVEDINAKATSLGCDTSLATNANYEQFKNSLP